MNTNEHHDSLEEEHPLDPGIRAAFGGASRASRRSHPSVLETVSGHREVRRVLLRDVDQDTRAVVRPAGEGAADYPLQIDRYQVVGEIARGGVGVVLRARDLDLGREVALKILLDRHRGNEELNSRFLEEAQIGGQLEHPGIVSVYEIGLYDRDRPYLAMKFVRGQTLAELLESRESPDEERSRFVSIFQQVCQTMAYAHSKGVIHRDLKPSNVIVGPFGEVQIMDWGLAKVLSKGGIVDDAKTTKRIDATDRDRALERDESVGSRSIAGSVMGTPAYMPPEQAKGKVESLDERSDVFGLGALLCEILTGHPPYTGADSRETLRKARTADLDDARHRLKTCTTDAELLELARSCLRPNARERPRNANVVAKKIQSYLQSLDARARALEIRAGKARLKLALALVAIVGLIAGGTGYFLVEKERRKQKQAVDAAVLQSESLVGRARASNDLPTWEAALHEANRALDLARGNVDSSEVDRLTALRDAIAADVKDQRALAKLERLRQDRGWDSDEISREIQDVFASDYAVDIYTTSADEAAATIRDSSISSSLVLALDQWTLLERGPLREKLFAIAQVADADEWRSRVRSAVMEDDEVALVRLAHEAIERNLDSSTFELLVSALQHPGPLRLRRRDPRHDELIEKVWRRAQAVHPDDFWINAQLGRFLRYRKAYGEALQYTRIAVALRPTNGYVRYQLGAVLEETGAAAEALKQLTRSILLDPGFGKAYRRLGELLGEPLDVPREAIEMLLRDLERIVDSGERFDREELPRLKAKAQAALGDTAGAVLTLEAALRTGSLTSGEEHPFRRRGFPPDELQEYRRRLEPDLVSYASIDAALDGKLPSTTAEEAIARFRELREGSDSARLRLAYLDARLLERRDRFEEAAARFREVVARDSTLPEPFLRLAQCLRRTGRAVEAEATLRRGLAVETVRCPPVWKLWTEIAFVDLDRTAEELLEGFPALETVTQNTPSYGNDLHRALERLASGEPILINCGGEAYRATDGTLWGRDRFFSAGSRSFFGRVFFGEISGTADDPLYQTERWFPRGATEPKGYSVPLPRGTYVVELRFAEIFEHHRHDLVLQGKGTEGASRLTKSTPRVFDVGIEGETVLERYSPGRVGFATADRFEVEVSVQDGFLDIETKHRQGNPKISAIAVRKKA